MHLIQDTQNLPQPHVLEPIHLALKQLGAKYQIEKIVLFGSRARGDYNDRSDIDLAIYGMNPEQQPAFWWEVEALPTLLKFDLVHINNFTDTTFVQNIEKDGVTLYEKS